MITKEQKKLLGKLFVANRASVIDDIEERILDGINMKDVTRSYSMIRYMTKILSRTTEASRPVFNGLINQWVRYDEETWKAAWIVEGHNPNVVLARMEGAGFNTEGYYSGHAGGSFANPMYARRVGHNRILVTQRGGLDV